MATSHEMFGIYKAPKSKQERIKEREKREKEENKLESLNNKKTKILVSSVRGDTIINKFEDYKSKILSKENLEKIKTKDKNNKRTNFETSSRALKLGEKFTSDFSKLQQEKDKLKSATNVFQKLEIYKNYDKIPTSDSSKRFFANLKNSLLEEAGEDIKKLNILFWNSKGPLANEAAQRLEKLGHPNNCQCRECFRPGQDLISKIFEYDKKMRANRKEKDGKTRLVYKVENGNKIKAKRETEEAIKRVEERIKLEKGKLITKKAATETRKRVYPERIRQDRKRDERYNRDVA